MLFMDTIAGGFFELVTFGGELHNYEWDGTSAFLNVSEQPALSLAGLNSVAVADLDTDGDEDFVLNVLYNDGLLASIDVMFSDADGFTPGQSEFGESGYSGICSADFDSDGDIDFVVGSRVSGVWLFRNDGQGAFSEELIACDGERIQDVAAGDFNGDGLQDVAIFPLTGSGVVGVGAGDGTFRTFWPVPNLTRVAPAVGDLNGDGRDDLVFQSTYSLVSRD